MTGGPWLSVSMVERRRARERVELACGAGLQREDAGAGGAGERGCGAGGWA